MKYCSKCGKDNKDETKFCKNCGYQFKVEKKNKQNNERTNNNKEINNKQSDESRQKSETRQNKQNNKEGQDKQRQQNKQNNEENKKSGDRKNKQGKKESKNSIGITNKQNQEINNVENINKQSQQTKNIENKNRQNQQKNNVNNINNQHQQINNEKNIKQTKNQTVVEAEGKKPKKRFKLWHLICIVLTLSVAAGGGIFVFYDDIIASKYESELEKATDLKDKFGIYNKMYEVGDKKEIKNKILEMLSKDIYNLKYVNNMGKLSKNDRYEIKRQALENFAKEKFESKEYIEAKEILDKAAEYGYDKENSEFYNDVISKIKDKDKTPEKVDEKDKSKEKYMMPDSDKKYLTTEELKKFSKYDLGIIRNEIYARHGYIFNQEPYKSYFKEKSWYIPNTGFTGSDNQLNDYEIKNVELIKKLEK